MALTSRETHETANIRREGGSEFFISGNTNKIGTKTLIKWVQKHENDV